MQRYLSTEDGWQTVDAGGFGKADDAVETVVIGDRKTGQSEPNCFLDKFFRMRRPIEKREVRMAMQLRIGSRIFDPTDRSVGLVGQPFPGPCRRVTAVAALRNVRRTTGNVCSTQRCR